LTPRSLAIEVTESSLIEDVALPHRVLDELKSLGVPVLLDDFGTGYSSLSYVKQFALDALKLDRSFVAGIGVDPQDSAIVQAVLDLARALDLDVVAEGVETPDQHERLRRAGCQYLQGFGIARPMPAAQVADFLAVDDLGVLGASTV
jgi:EAL domain-containing protein (putative c-di-GMP-specific phosphodiesterase class I)